jgi:hypothetical protein
MMDWSETGENLLEIGICDFRGHHRYLPVI